MGQKALWMARGKVFALLVGFFGVVGGVFGADDVVFSIVLHRHGDRSPTLCIPADPDCSGDFPEGFGMLSPVGMSQGHALGVGLNDRYAGSLIRHNYTRRDVVVRSTDYPRTLMTSESVLQGLYPPGQGPMLPSYAGSGPALTSARLQPVPENTVTVDDDWLLRGWSGATCPAFAAAGTKEQSQDKAEWDAQRAIMANIRTPLGNALGVDPASITAETVYMYADALIVYRDHQIPWPPGITEDLFYQANNVSEFSLQHLFWTKEQQRLAAGPLLNEWTLRLEAAMNNQPQPGWDPSSFPANDSTPGTDVGPRLALYSAHDATIVSVLKALDAYNGVHPPYASSVVVELLKDNSIRMFYNMGSAANVLWTTQITPPTCTGNTCTMTEWHQQVDPVSLPLEQAPKACNPSKSSKKSSSNTWSQTQIIITAATAAGSFLLGLVIMYLCKPKAKPQQRSETLPLSSVGDWGLGSDYD